jgi:hypothetical protein
MGPTEENFVASCIQAPPAPFTSSGFRFRPLFATLAATRRAARERGGPLPSIGVADALLDERRELEQVGYNPLRGLHNSRFE